MKPYSVGLGIIAALVVACLSFPAVWGMSGNIPSKFFGEAVAADTSSGHLKAVLPVGHGSAVHIGNGFVVTAAHVVNGVKSIALHSENGTIYQADVLWINTEYDIAFLKVHTPLSIGSVPLNCAANFAGQKIKAFGNPSDIEFAYTLGEVVGNAREHGPWKSVVPVDMTIIPGMSGGGVVDTDGKLVGISVGVMLYGYGLAGIGYIVPARAICELRGIV